MSIRRKMDLLITKGDAFEDTNHDCNQKDSRTVKNRLAGKRNQVSKEGESRNNEDVNRRPVEVVERQASVHSQRQQLQQPQPQVPQGPIVRWENFLPVRSLKVLLVENDDSTRQVVSALLRNCCYQVRSVSNGLEAWIILQDLTNHVDLVLTEVGMPGLSGINLLSKIMSHKTCKNIPVIMMSSNDSMGVVFKCLSNGAVDFLVKPIRKNELRNLWQHVWRKCHSSSGSGSESGIRTEKSTKSKSVDGSDNNSDSNDEEDSEGTGLMYKNGSDNDSGIQSSCSKRVLEVPNHPISQWDDLADPPGSTCAQVICSRTLESESSIWVPTNVTKRFREEDDEPDNVAMGKDLTIGTPTSSEVQLRKHTDKVGGEVSSTGTCRLIDIDVKKYEKKQGKDAEEHNIDTAKDKMQHKGKDVINAIADVSISCRESALNEVINDLPKVTKVKNVDPCDEKEPSLELGLQRLTDVGNSGSNAQGHNILKHSDHSAFSRYNTSSTTNQGVTKTESMQHLQGHSTGTPNQGSNGSRNSIDMGSTTNNVSTKTKSSNDEPIPRSTVSVHHSYAYDPVHHGHCPAPQTIMPGNPDATKMVATQEMAMHQHTQVEHHHHHHYHHHHHHVHSSQQQQKLPLNSVDSSSRNLVAATSNCVPSDKLGIAIEGNVANYASASESNNGNTGKNRKGTAGIAEGTNVTNDNGSLGACTTGSGIRSGLDQDRLTLREAALNKFRQKRKERCFEKKVRYESRKMLAEQRPRVRGQFVRRATDGNKTRDENNDTNS